MQELRFGHDKIKDIPIALLTNHQAWDDFISDIWAEVLKAEGFSKTARVLEIGPGVSTKVGGALAKLGFCGQLYVVDPLPDVLDILSEKYKKLMPHADIRYISQSFSAAMTQIPETVDVILCSHILDDMIIHEAEIKALEWSKNYTHYPSQDLKRVWQNLSQDAGKLQQIKKDITRQVVQAIQNLAPDLVVLNQYPSATLDDHDMNSLNKHAKDVLLTIKADISERMQNRDLQKILNSFPNYNNPHIANNVLNIENWMVCRKK